MPPLGWSSENIWISPETRGIVLPDTENHTIVSSFIWTQYRNVMDGRTDGRMDRETGRQTDGILLASTVLCIASNVDAL